MSHFKRLVSSLIVAILTVALINFIPRFFSPTVNMFGPEDVIQFVCITVAVWISIEVTARLHRRKSKADLSP